MNGKKARELRKVTKPLAVILHTHKKALKFTKPEMFNPLRRCRKAFTRNGYNGFLQLCQSVGLDPDKIAKKYFNYA